VESDLCLIGIAYTAYYLVMNWCINFIGILSTIFLKRKLQWFKWLGMILVIGGLVTVGANDLINGNVSSPFDTGYQQ
jgi:drug/metabolite transporter (DMT)-like permease